MRILPVLLLLLLAASAGAQSGPIDVEHYRFELELTDRSDAITGKATVRIRFNGPSAEFSLDLSSVEEDKGMQAFAVQQLTPAASLRFHHRNDRLTITLAQPAAAGEVRSFVIDYMGTPKDGLVISKNKHGERTFFGDNWPDRAHNWLPCHDTPADKASVEFVVTAPAHYRVVSNGLLQSEKPAGSDRRVTHWKEEQPLPTKVMVIGAARFAVKRVDRGNNIPVTAWVYPQDSTRGFYDYVLADSILRFFSGYIAPYPYKKLANVQSTTIFGGMENASAIFYAENSVTGDRRSEDLIAHEIVHQWFGNTATEKSFAHLWLSEGFATYLTNIYIEQKYGVDSLRQRLRSDRLRVIRFALEHPRLPVVDSSSALMDLLNANSYQKGGWVLHLLRQEVGDPVFQKIIQSYFQKYKNANAETRDFQQVAETVSGRSLDWFFRQWLYEPGLPGLDIIRAKTGDRLSLKIVQQKQLFRLTLELAVTEPGGRRTIHRIPISQRETNFELPVSNQSTIEIDPNVNLVFSYQNR